LEPLLPDRTPRRGGQWLDHRKVVNGVMWRTRTGSPWRDLPPLYGHWKTVYNRHRRWSADGTWSKALAGLRAGADMSIGESEWVVGVDAAVIRAHHHAAGARHAPPVDVAKDVLAPAVLTGGRIE
jgi:transposase